MKFIELGKEEQRNIIRGLKERTGMSEQILEKDLWVSAVISDVQLDDVRELS